ncbi:MAG: sulfur carrier protein ThiS [Pseudomonadota bacterium]|nr:sulfur carrier protein ThiS [Pseudomonadota bacterium]
MRIKVNGESRDFDGPMSVEALARLLALNSSQVAVEKNREIVPRSRYGEVGIAEGDEIEIVRFIGGG